jgi:hypothetical protein
LKDNKPQQCKHTNEGAAARAADWLFEFTHIGGCRLERLKVRYPAKKETNLEIQTDTPFIVNKTCDV